MEVLFTIISLAAVWAGLKLLFFLKEYKRKWDIFKGLPGPGVRAIPFLGHALILTGTPDKYYENVLKLMIESPARETSDVGLAWVGTVPVLIVGGAKAAESILHSSDHTEKTFFYDFLHSWLGTGLLTSSGEKWKSRRRLLTPTFHFSILKDFLEVMNEQAKVFMEKLSPYSNTEKSFDVWKPVTLCTLDIICETAMGKSINAQDNENSEYVKAIYKCTEFILDRGKSPWLWPNFIYRHTADGKEYEKCLRIVHEFTRSVIQDRKDNFGGTFEKKKRLAFLDTLMTASDDGTPLSFKDIQEETDTFMFEGHDTTAAALSWAIYLIGLHPKLQRKIHAELDEVFYGKLDIDVTMNDLANLKYLDLVVKEALRLLPSVPMIGRVTTRDCTVDGHFIPERTECLIFLHAVNNNPRYWTEPLRFDPERFTVENSVGRHPYAYVPFSAGPRNCIGQKFATMEEKVILAHFLQKYSVESCDRIEDIKLMGDVILRSRNGINIKIERRSVEM